MNVNRLHIYGQTYNHDHAFIVGDTTALIALRDAIDAALETGSTVGETTVFAADGEGYDIKVYREEEDKYWDKSLLPYTDETLYSPPLEDVIGPWDLFKKYKKG